MTPTALLIPTYRQMLLALALWLRKAEAQVDDADALMAARLAPDMFPLSTQIRFACRQAYEGVYRLRHEHFPAAIDALLDEGRNGGDQPGTVAEAQARIDETLAFLDTLAPDALDAGAGQPLELELPMGLTFDLEGEGYARDWALSQFYFHLMTAYAILRNQRVELGKADYVQHMFAFLRPGTAPAS
ncbi:MAG: DUF1993 domain-containing protein [Alphaproteobacteria bacterium]|nr:DUF1993 domain-containing protein [Alphaproteobacteria bacterium]MBU2084752.1 DUF1993 domain-containing protein [Alphaproteobacteria bacterium]MBU2144170.1 DUF1993 domain-containing protein [Alphaproteobacteria bacterium]MBU2198285.1 DUF1993 domain-containing protein [Alphaproteobacteria bacterium]